MWQCEGQTPLSGHSAAAAHSMAWLVGLGQDLQGRKQGNEYAGCFQRHELHKADPHNPHTSPIAEKNLCSLPLPHAHESIRFVIPCTQACYICYHSLQCRSLCVKYSAWAVCCQEGNPKELTGISTSGGSCGLKNCYEVMPITSSRCSSNLTPLLPPTLSFPCLPLNKLQTPPFSQRPGPNPTKPPCPTCCFTCLQCFPLAPSSPVTSNPAP